VKDSRLGFAGENLREEFHRLLDHGQCLLAIECRPIRKDLDNDERIWVRNVSTYVEADGAIEGSARGHDFPECGHGLVGFLRLALHFDA
jgi:hypothetical protein